MSLILSLTVLLLIIGLLENYFHQKNLKDIPIRIHVNGSRGKSTVTRLIAAGLRGAGLQVIAKTTGTAPTIILEDGSELIIKRRGTPRIIEQLRVISLARKRRADVVVIECMAIKPEMQWVSERKLIKATMGVITNIRADHCEEMGWTLREIAETLSLTIPEKGKLVTAEGEYFTFITKQAEKVNTGVYQVKPSLVQDFEVMKFPYLAFKDNIACALKVCEILGVKRELALQDMWAAQPDPGALRIFNYQWQGRNIFLINALAANDLASYKIIWENLANDKRYKEIMKLPLVSLFNNRSDRLMRSRDLVNFHQQHDFYFTFLVGESKIVPYLLLRQAGIKQKQIKILSRRRTIKGLLQELVKVAEKDIAVFASGNIKGIGLQLAEFFEQNGEELI